MNINSSRTKWICSKYKYVKQTICQKMICLDRLHINEPIAALDGKQLRVVSKVSSQLNSELSFTRLRCIDARHCVER